jgi:ketosteroid isomerase-like protein
MAQARGDAGLSDAAPTTNVETFTAIRDAYTRGDYQSAWELLDPQIEWIEPREMPGAGAYRGHDGVRESLTKFVGTWSDYRVEHHILAEAGDQLYVRVHISGKGRSSGAPGAFDEYQVWTFRDGKVTRVEMFLDEAEGRRVAGLGPTAKEMG